MLEWVGELEDLLKTPLRVQDFLGQIRGADMYNVRCMTPDCPFKLIVYYRQSIGNDLKIIEQFQLDHETGHRNINHVHENQGKVNRRTDKVFGKNYKDSEWKKC